MNRAVVGVGSNIDPEENVGRAREILSKEENMVAASKFSFTAPEGIPDQPDFLNGAFLIETELDEAALRFYLKGVEERLGRVRGAQKDGPRSIDLDLVVFNSDIVDDDYYRYGFVRRAVLELLPGLE